MIDDQIELLSTLVTPRRFERMRAVLEHRTRYLTVAVEDVYQSHNASAVLRSCDSFGVQDVHIIEQTNAYEVNPAIELGTAQWLSLHSCARTDDCIEALRTRGYRIVATTPHGETTKLPDFSLAPGPVALLFGTEMHGLSDQAMALADERLEIPMTGFVESLNISVSAAVILYTLTSRLRTEGIDWALPQDQQKEILFTWLRSSVKEADEHLRRAGLSCTD